MQFTIAGESYDFIESKFTFGEAKALEKVTGLSFQDLMADRSQWGHANVLQAMLWISMKRPAPTTAYADLDDVAIDEIEFTVDEPAPDESADDEAGPTSPAPGADAPEPAATTSSTVD